MYLTESFPTSRNYTRVMVLMPTILEVSIGGLTGSMKMVPWCFGNKANHIYFIATFDDINWCKLLYGNVDRMYPFLQSYKPNSMKTSKSFGWLDLHSKPVLPVCIRVLNNNIRCLGLFCLQDCVVVLVFCTVSHVDVVCHHCKGRVSRRTLNP